MLKEKYSLLFDKICDGSTARTADLAQVLDHVKRAGYRHTDHARRYSDDTDRLNLVNRGEHKKNREVKNGGADLTVSACTVNSIARTNAQKARDRADALLYDQGDE